MKRWFAYVGMIGMLGFSVLACNQGTTPTGGGTAQPEPENVETPAAPAGGAATTPAAPAGGAATTPVAPDGAAATPAPTPAP